MNKIWLQIYYKQAGVEGDNSWSKTELANDEYLIDATKYDYLFTIRPF